MEKPIEISAFFGNFYCHIFTKILPFCRKENISWLDINLHCQKMVIIPFCV